MSTETLFAASRDKIEALCADLPVGALIRAGAWTLESAQPIEEDIAQRALSALHSGGILYAETQLRQDGTYLIIDTDPDATERRHLSDVLAHRAAEDVRANALPGEIVEARAEADAHKVWHRSMELSISTLRGEVAEEDPAPLLSVTRMGWKALGQLVGALGGAAAALFCGKDVPEYVGTALGRACIAVGARSRGAEAAVVGVARDMITAIIGEYGGGPRAVYEERLGYAAGLIAVAARTIRAVDPAPRGTLIRAVIRPRPGAHTAEVDRELRALEAERGESEHLCVHGDVWGSGCVVMPAREDDVIVEVPFDADRYPCLAAAISFRSPSDED